MNAAPAAPQANGRPRLDWQLGLLLLALTLGLVADGWSRLRPGPFSIDEVTYQLMARSAVDGRLFVWNGYDELPSPELQTLQVRATPGGLSAQYPAGYAFVAAPFLALFGYRGLFVLNALAFVATALVCHRLALRIVGDRRWALLASAFWASGTYAWSYALSIWPHSVAVLAVVATALCCVRGSAALPRRLALAWFFAAGLICGLGTSVRLDVSLCALPLLAPALLRGRSGYSDALAFAAGMVPGVALLSAVNFAKWGSLMPLSYGSKAHDATIPWTLAVTLAALLLSLKFRSRIGRSLGTRGALAGAVALVALVALLPGLRRQLLALLEGVFALVIDAGALPVDASELAIERSPSGAVIYEGGLKKALIQSSPALPLALVAFVVLLRKPVRFDTAWLLAGIPLSYIGFYGASAWHGGMCFSMRYLLPVLPFAAIASALALRALSCSGRWLTLSSAGGVGFALVVMMAVTSEANSSARSSNELLLLAMPLLMAGMLAVTVTVWALRSSAAAARVSVLLAALGYGHAFAVTMAYDVPIERRVRAFNRDVAERVSAHVSDDSLLFAQDPDSLYLVAELRERVRIALPLRDGFRDFTRLASFHARSGRRVYAAFRGPIWRALADGGRLEGFELTPLTKAGGFELYELREGQRFAGDTR